jgi:hypothetical protein
MTFMGFLPLVYGCFLSPERAATTATSSHSFETRKLLDSKL